MDVNIKCSCYADDLTCFLKDIKSADNMLRTLDMFYSCSSLKVNVEKTEAMWLGSCRNFDNTPLPLVWTKHVKVLGIFFSYNEQLANDLNFDAKITSLKQTLALWKNRDLTAIGKIVIVKTFGLSKFLYVSNLITMPSAIQKQMNSIIHKCIWNGPDKIKRTVFMANYDEGGLKMVDIF